MNINKWMTGLLAVAVMAVACIAEDKEKPEDKSYLHEWKARMGEVADDGKVIDLRKLDSALLMPGAVDWGRTHSVFFERRLRDRETPFFSTYHRWLKNESFGATWLVIRKGDRPAVLEFFVRGGDARFLLLKGDCRIAEMANVQQMEKALSGRLAGKIIYDVTGDREAKAFRDLKWDLPKGSSTYTLLVLDNLKEDWGFIEVSTIKYQRK